MGQSEPLLWERRQRRRAGLGRRARLGTEAEPGSALGEWTARPLGRLGRPLVAEIETYLEFFAIARAADGA